MSMPDPHRLSPSTALCIRFGGYRLTSLTRKLTPLGPYRRPMPRVLGGWAFSYERGTPVGFHVSGVDELGVGRLGSGFRIKGVGRGVQSIPDPHRPSPSTALCIGFGF